MPQALVDPAILSEVCKKHRVSEETILKIVEAEKSVPVRTHRLKELKRFLGGG